VTHADRAWLSLVLAAGVAHEGCFSIKDMSVEETNNGFALDDIALVACP
jgi:hypothetical protein